MDRRDGAPVTAAPAGAAFADDALTDDTLTDGAPIDDGGKAVPTSRTGRLLRVGGLAADVASDMLVNGARAAVTGGRPDMRDLLLTPRNARKVADELAKLRGAAMKVGQLLSMDGGDFLPPELAEVLARLRASATPMPPQQLKSTLNRAWGAGWLKKFSRFDAAPMAAASIGQVHRATTRDGRDLAIKVQYPGVRDSISSDVDNMGALIGLSRLAPKSLDVDRLLDEAKRQLHEEADYEREGACMERFAGLLDGDPDYLTPRLQADLTTPSVLAMTRLGGAPVEDFADADQAVRDRIVMLAIRLLYRELFEFRLMQTDPNFANFRYDAETGRLILLDFGATHELSPALSEGYRRLVAAGYRGDEDAMFDAVRDIGLMDPAVLAAQRAEFADMLRMATEPLRLDGPFDFAASDLAGRLRDKGLDLPQEDVIGHTPPTDALYLHRKFGGIYLLAVRLKARVDVRALFKPYADGA
ncbi:MAG: AarF/ABC1/UbiB kinase family protein [Pseudomonadota bacterium]